jgi:hypothetical protein
MFQFDTLEWIALLMACAIVVVMVVAFFRKPPKES